MWVFFPPEEMPKIPRDLNSTLARACISAWATGDCARSLRLHSVFTSQCGFVTWLLAKLAKLSEILTSVSAFYVGSDVRRVCIIQVSYTAFFAVLEKFALSEIWVVP